MMVEIYLILLALNSRGPLSIDQLISHLKQGLGPDRGFFEFVDTLGLELELKEMTEEWGDSDSDALVEINASGVVAITENGRRLISESELLRYIHEHMSDVEPA